MCFRGLNFDKKTSLGWEVAPATNTFNWCHVRSIIKVMGRVSGAQPKWPIYVDMTDIFEELPRLQERDRGERSHNIRKKLKKGKKEIRRICLFGCCERFWTKWVSGIVKAGKKES